MIPLFSYFYLYGKQNLIFKMSDKLSLMPKYSWKGLHIEYLEISNQKKTQRVESKRSLFSTSKYIKSYVFSSSSMILCIIIFYVI